MLTKCIVILLNFILPSYNRVREVNGFLVSKETVLLCRWERSKQKLGYYQ